MTGIRKSIIGLLLGFAIVPQAWAQRDVADIFRILKVKGVTLYLEPAVNRSLPGIDSFERRWFPGFGVGAHKVYENTMGWRVAMEYNGHNVQQIYRDNVQTTSRRITAHYFDLPLALMIAPDRNNPDLAVEVGLIPSLYLGSTLGVPDSVPMNASAQVAEARGETAFNAMLMFGANFPISENFHLNFQYRYPLPFAYASSGEITGRVPVFRFGIRLPINRGKPRKRKEPAPPVIQTIDNLELFVRIDDRMREVESLRAAGKEVDAEVIRIRSFERNQMITEAFVANLYPGRVYFFRLEDSRTAITDIENLRLLNPQTLEYDSTIKPVCKNYLFAEFSRIPMEEFGQLGPEGLVIYNQKMEVLKEPFPFFTSAKSGLRSPAEVVSRFSRSLQRYLRQYGLIE